jgi:hypothetical protein
MPIVRGGHSPLPQPNGLRPAFLALSSPPALPAFRSTTPSAAPPPFSRPLLQPAPLQPYRPLQDYHSFIGPPFICRPPFS